ncbi:chorismate mutase [Novosphingobium lubricantis]
MHEGPPLQAQFEPFEPRYSGVDAIDRQILLLLSQRFALARSMGEGVWEDFDERQAALAAIRREAFALGVPVALVADFWDRLAEASLAMRDQARRPHHGG